MLALFPASSLDNSILTSIVIGVAVMWGLQETFGWGLSGLLVPGYLATIFVLQPSSGLVVVGEALVAYLIVTALSDGVPRWWLWTPAFGRDRFMLFLLVSVAVRLSFEAGGLDWIAGETRVPALHGLHSMGLLVVPLLANSLWRSGLGRGLVRMGAPVVVTFLVLTALLRWTNLSLSSFALTFEDLALDFVSSPRAYIVLLVGAAMGSAANLRWGWDYGGIIVPGLLALCWSEPRRIASTCGEVVVLTTAVRALLNLPVLRGANLTGGRPLVLTFGVAYALRFVTGWVLSGGWLDVSAHDLAGFGYLLTTILALRALKAGDLPRVLVPAVVTSLAAFVSGTALSWALAILMPASAPPAPAPAPPTEAPDLALLESAWTATGRVPVRPSALVADGAHRVVTAGDGFGVLLVRGGDGPVVTGRAGNDVIGPVTVALAEALDARAMLLCAPEGEACAVARADLSRVAPVLEIAEGATTHLALPVGASGRMVDLGRLGRAIGTYDLETGADTLRLTLAPDAALHAAAGGFPGEVGPLALPLARPDPPRDVPRAWSEGELRLLQQYVVMPWMTWRAGDAGADDALRLGAGIATRLGVSAAGTGDVGVLSGDGWEAVLRRTGEALVVEAPDVHGDPDAGTLAASLSRALHAAALVLDRTGQRENSPARIAVLGMAAGFGDAVDVVTVRTLPAGVDPGGDVVLSEGRPVLSAEGESAITQRVRALFEGHGLRVARWDGAAARAAFTDPADTVRAAARLATHREAHVTVYASRRALEALDARVAGVSP